MTNKVFHFFLQSLAEQLIEMTSDSALRLRFTSETLKWKGSIHSLGRELWLLAFQRLLH